MADLVERFAASLNDLIDYVRKGSDSADIKLCMWVPARPLGFCSISNRIRCAWAVFTGRADAVEWPGQ